MSSSFDWSEFEESATPRGDSFDWKSFEQDQPKLPEMKRQVGRLGKAVGSSVLGIPGDIAESMRNLSASVAKKLTGRPTSEGAQKAFRGLMPFGALPTSGELKQKTEQAFPSLEPRTEGEATEEEIIGLLSSLAVPFPGGKAKAFKDPKTLEKLYKAGKSMGLNPEQLAPLFQGEKKAALLGKFAKQTPKLKKTFQLTEGALSDVYSGLKESAATLPKMTEPQTDIFLEKIAKIKIDLQKTLQPSPDKQAAIHFIEKAIEKTNNFGASPEELINFYQDINSSVNWNAIRGGKKMLERLKHPVMDAIKEANPRIAQKFADTNALYSRMKGIQKQIGLPKIEKYLEYGKWASLLGGLMFGNVKGIASGAAAIAIPRVATELLTNPKWQSIHKRILHSVKSGSKSGAFKAYQLLKDKIRKEMPEEYREIDWSDFETEL